MIFCNCSRALPDALLDLGRVSGPGAVFISATTTPAAAFAVVAATFGEWRTAAESTLQLVVSMIGIVLAFVLVLPLRTCRHGPDLGCPLAEG